MKYRERVSQLQQSAPQQHAIKAAMRCGRGRSFVCVKYCASELTHE